MVESFGNFPIAEKEYLLDIFSKELHEEKRECLHKRHIEVKRNFQKGKVKLGTVQDLMADLDED